MKESLFSIICPVYNAEKTLVSAIESVLQQDYEKWELVLVDDGSSDSSGEICDRYARNDARIRVLHKKNEGQAEARFDGASIAKGEYLLFLDSDDQYEPNALNTIKEKVETNQYDLVVYNAKIVLNKKIESLYSFDSQKIENPIVECFCKRRVSYLWSICLRRDLFINIDDEIKNIFFKLRYSEDLFLIYNIVKKVQKKYLLFINQELYRYIFNENSITKTQNASKVMDRFFVFNYVYSDLFNNYGEYFNLIKKEDRNSAGWTYLSAAKKIALELPKEEYLRTIKAIRESFLFKHLNDFKKDRYSFIGYILLRLKMYRLFKQYIIKHER